MRVINSGKEQITLYYGQQKLNGKDYYHEGIDIVKQTNSLDSIVAAEKGRVTKVVSDVKGRDLKKGFGNYVELQHSDNVITKYCHLKYGSIKVKTGQIVSKGQEIGFMGDSGYTFGAHLHFQIIINGKSVDPLPYLKDQKEIRPYADNNYTIGNYIVITDVLNVRKGPGKKYDIIRYPELTNNAKEQIQELVNYTANGYVKNMEFTAVKIENMLNETWAKTPSGWVCIYNSEGIYCKRK